MHFSNIISLEIPKEEEDGKINKEILEEIERLKQNIDKTSKTYIRDSVRLKSLLGLTNTFARNVEDVAGEYLDKFASEPENDDYLEFEDQTDEVKDLYETERCDFMKFPNGKIVFCDAKFCIENRRVYEKTYKKNIGYGDKFIIKRNKKAKKIRVLLDYPVKKVYTTLEDYASFCNYKKGPKEGTFGQYYNPNGIYDWYSLGGRWADTFLVKNDCKEYSIGYRDDDDYRAPYGYKWVAAARKKDIEWKVQKRFLKKREIVMFYTLLQQNRFGFFPFPHRRLCSFLNIESLLNDLKFYVRPISGFVDGEGNYISEECLPREDNKWCQMVSNYIEGLDDDTVLVQVDMHI